MTNKSDNKRAVSSALLFSHTLNNWNAESATLLGHAPSHAEPPRGLVYTTGQTPVDRLCLRSPGARASDCTRRTVSLQFKVPQDLCEGLKRPWRNWGPHTNEGLGPSQTLTLSNPKPIKNGTQQRAGRTLASETLGP